MEARAIRRSRFFAVPWLQREAEGFGDGGVDGEVAVLAGDEADQAAALVGLFDNRLARQAQMVFTASAGPGQLDKLPARLTSRFAAGLVVGLLPFSPANRLTFLTDRGFGAAVVIDDAGHPLGVVTKTDILVHAKQHPAVGDDSATVADVMTPAVFSVREDTSAESVVEQMLALNVHHLFVVDDAGVVVGVISPLDIVRQLG